jgi:hypothetical protein
MGFFKPKVPQNPQPEQPKKKPETPPGQGAKDPRDQVGQNPTGRERKSSARSRGKASRKADKDLKGTRWGKKDGDG